MGRPRSKPLPRGVHERRYASGTVAYWIDFRDAAGVRVQELGGSTIADAVRKLGERRAQVAAGTFTRELGSGEQTVATYAAKWIELRRAEGVRSADREHQLLRDHVLPHLGAKRLSELRPRDVAALVRALEGKLAPKSIRNAHGVLSALLARARFDELITDNPARGLPRGILPKPTRVREVGAWTRDELEAFITSHDDVPEDRTVAYAIAAFTGARVGEVAGLRWRDLDVDAKPLWRWALRAQYDRQPLKTDNPRDVPIHAELARILAAWKLEGWPRYMRRQPRPDDFVVPREDGTVHSKQSLGAKAVHRHAAKLGITSAARDFHSFRRAMITIARTDGAREDVLERVTHNAAGAMIDGYTYFGWDALCAAVACMRIAPRAGVVVQLRAASNGDTHGDAAGGAVAKASVFNEMEMEAPGVEAVSRSPSSAIVGDLALKADSPPPSGGPELSPIAIPFRRPLPITHRRSCRGRATRPGRGWRRASSSDAARARPSCSRGSARSSSPTPSRSCSHGSATGRGSRARVSPSRRPTRPAEPPRSPRPPAPPRRRHTEPSESRESCVQNIREAVAEAIGEALGVEVRPELVRMTSGGRQAEIVIGGTFFDLRVVDGPRGVCLYCIACIPPIA